MATAKITHSYPDGSGTEMLVEVDGSWRDGVTVELIARVLDLYHDIVGVGEDVEPEILTDE